MSLPPHLLKFPLYVPRVIRLLKNWPIFLFNYTLRRKVPATYIFRNGIRLLDCAGTLAGTIAVVYLRREYGIFPGAKTILDIGANMGAFATYAASSCPDAMVYCYEPETTNAACLEHNISENALSSRVVVHKQAVAGQSGIRQLIIDESTRHSLTIKPTGETTSTPVGCVTLADILDSHNLSTVDLLKMNCEGAEYEILDASREAVIQRIRDLRIEYHNLPSPDMNGDSLATIIRRRGFVVRRFTRYLDQSGFIWASRGNGTAR